MSLVLGDRNIPAQDGVQFRYGRALAIEVCKQQWCATGRRGSRPAPVSQLSFPRVEISACIISAPPKLVRKRKSQFRSQLLVCLSVGSQPS